MYNDTSLRQRLRKNNFHTQAEMVEHFGVSSQTLTRGINSGALPYHYILGSKWRLLKKGETLKFLQQKRKREDENRVSKRKVFITRACNYCNVAFRYSRIMKISKPGKERVELGGYINGTHVRKWCDDCKELVATKKRHTEATKKAIGAKTKAWWANLTPKEREDKKVRLSLQKKKYWDSPKGQKRKKIFGAQVSEGWKKFWTKPIKERASKTVGPKIRKAYRIIEESESR